MIEVEDLTKYYGGKRAIHGLNFRIEKGEIVGFLGLNAAGKTTTLRILGCLILPSSGTVKIDGLDTAQSAHEIRRRLGFLPDKPPLYEEMTVTGFLTFVAELKGLEGRAAQNRVSEAIELCNLKEVRDQVVGTLSHGFKQRVGIAQAVVHKPTLLILDEPTGGLDPVQIVEMRELIKRLGGQHTVLLSSHNLGEISQTCDRLLVINKGEIVADGTEQAISRRIGNDGESGVLDIEVEGARDASADKIADDATRIIGKVQGVLVVRAVHKDENRVRLEVEFNADRRPIIARELVNHGLGLLRLDRRSLELEQVFQRLTSQKRKEVSA